MVFFLYNLYIFVWIQHGCLNNTVFALGPSSCLLWWSEINFKISGPSYSKQTMLLVNVSWKLWSFNMAYMLIFLLKKNVFWLLHLQKLLTFSAKIPVDKILYLPEQLTFWPLASSLS